MGMQGPLTAQALGRSPYDDAVVAGDGEDEKGQPPQEYDRRGRLINPETKRINRDIIRSHNEVMLVIGVAEPENPYSSQEIESQRRHLTYEEDMAYGIAEAAKYFFAAFKSFGVSGLRQRILVYKRFSHIPFWGLYQQTRKDFSLSRDVLAGAPTMCLSDCLRWWVMPKLLSATSDSMVRHRLVHEMWTYVRVHLELHATMQRLGLASNSLWFPSLSFFVPFSDTSPITAPSFPTDLSLSSLLQWFGDALISSTPFLAWVLTQRMLRDWEPQIWTYIFGMLPNTIFHGKLRPPPPPPPPPQPPQALPDRDASPDDSSGNENGFQSSPDASANNLPNANHTGAGGEEPAPASTSRRASVFSSRGDDYASEDEENDGVRATLISFDVEASEATDAPTGLWSAELRPSAAHDGRSNGAPLYFDTLLTQQPAFIASHMFTDIAMHVLIAPYEATALRLLAHTSRMRRGLPSWDIHNISLFSGLNATSVVNFLGTELIDLIISGELWAMLSGLSMWFHMSEDEWKEEEAKR